MLYISQTIFKIIALALVLLMVSVPATAEKQKAPRLKDLKKEAVRVDKKLRNQQAEIRKIEKKEADLLSSLNEIDRSLNRAKKKLTATRAQLNGVEKKIKNTALTSDELARQIQQGEDYASRRMAGLYKLHSLGAVNLLANAESVTDMLQRKVALEHLLASDNKLLEELNARHRKMTTLHEKQNTLHQSRMELLKQRKSQVEELRGRKNKRKKLLAAIHARKADEKAVLASLQRSAKSLDKKIAALRASARKKKSAPKTPKAPTASKQGFSRLKGLLKMPVEGKITSFFGPFQNEKYGVVNFQSGINIKAEQGSPVQSVYKGEVIYAGWFKGYGNMMIIDHGDHYYTLYAHAEELLKAKGDAIRTGDIIATVGDTGSINGPELHFEVRHHGKSIDPMKWIKKSG